MGKRHFVKDDLWMANKHVKKYLRLFAITEIQVKTITSYQYTSTRMVGIKKKMAITNGSKDAEK